MPKKSCGAAMQMAAADARDHLLTIEVVAKMFRVSTWTLRLYEWRGLIQRTSNGADSVYSWRDCERIALIVKAKRAGLTLGQIEPVIKAISLQASPETVKAGLQCCLDLIAGMTEYSDAIADVLAELERVKWELSTRLAGKPRG